MPEKSLVYQVYYKKKLHCIYAHYFGQIFLNFQDGGISSFLHELNSLN
jgi:hypothetical protein